MRMLSALALAALAFTGGTTVVDAKANTHMFHRLFKTMADGDVPAGGCTECTLDDQVCASPVTIQIPTAAGSTCDDLTSGISQISAFAADDACKGKINQFFCDLAGEATSCGGPTGPRVIPEWFDQRCGEVISCLNVVGQTVASQSDICGLIRGQFGGVVAPTGAPVDESSTGDVAPPTDESSTGDVIVVPVEESSSTGDVIIVPVDESSTGTEEPNQSTGIIQTSTGVVVVPPAVTGGLDGTGVTAVPIDGVSTGGDGGVVVNPPNNGGNNGNTNAANSAAGVSWMIMGLVLSLGVLLA